MSTDRNRPVSRRISELHDSPFHPTFPFKYMIIPIDHEEVINSIFGSRDDALNAMGTIVRYYIQHFINGIPPVSIESFIISDDPPRATYIRGVQGTSDTDIGLSYIIRNTVIPEPGVVEINMAGLSIANLRCQTEQKLDNDRSPPWQEMKANNVVVPVNEITVAQHQPGIEPKYHKVFRSQPLQNTEREVFSTTEADGTHWSYREYITPAIAASSEEGSTGTRPLPDDDNYINGFENSEVSVDESEKEGQDLEEEEAELREIFGDIIDGLESCNIVEHIQGEDDASSEYQFEEEYGEIGDQSDDEQSDRSFFGTDTPPEMEVTEGPDCPICYRRAAGVTLRVCGHQFCYRCIVGQWYARILFPNHWPNTIRCAICYSTEILRMHRQIFMASQRARTRLMWAETIIAEPAWLLPLLEGIRGLYIDWLVHVGYLVRVGNDVMIAK